jgi:hypothetical protein
MEATGSKLSLQEFEQKPHEFPVENEERKKEKETALTVAAHGGGGGALQEHDPAMQGEEDLQEARRCRRRSPAPAHVEA